MKSGKYYIYCINTIKSSKTFSKIWSSHYNNWKKYGCDKRTLDLHKDVDTNLKHEIEFIIKSNEPLAENKIKTRTIIVHIYVWKRYSQTKKTAKQMNCTNLFLTCHKD